jgi:hypothetical protein
LNQYFQNYKINHPHIPEDEIYVEALSNRKNKEYISNEKKLKLNLYGGIIMSIEDINETFKIRFSYLKEAEINNNKDNIIIK